MQLEIIAQMMWQRQQRAHSSVSQLKQHVDKLIVSFWVSHIQGKGIHKCEWCPLSGSGDVSKHHLVEICLSAFSSTALTPTV